MLPFSFVWLYIKRPGNLREASKLVLLWVSLECISFVILFCPFSHAVCELVPGFSIGLAEFKQVSTTYINNHTSFATQLCHKQKARTFPFFFHLHLFAPKTASIILSSKWIFIFVFILFWGWSLGRFVVVVHGPVRGKSVDPVRSGGLWTGGQCFQVTL